MSPFSVKEAYAQNTSSCFGQPTTQLSFASPTLISGTNLQAGARYRFSDIIGDGTTDGIIEILGLVNGASLNVIDNNAINPGNFQPELNAALNVDSGVDFRIEFVALGTNTPQFLDIAINSIDVDGNGNPAAGAPGNLREYVEYETTLNSFVLNDPTELDVDASGPSASDRIRFESRTTQFAPGIDPTALENIVAGLYTNINGFDFRVGALQAGAAGLNGANTRLTSLGFTCPNFPNPAPEPEANPDLTVTKSADLDTNVPAGTTVTYTYDVTNTGDVTLSNINLADVHNGSGAAPTPGSETLITDVAPIGNSTDAGANGVWDTLAPGDTVRFTATYVVTQADVDLLQ
jgi:uncharacterized repeat protein (TIGR01451 family)